MLTRIVKRSDREKRTRGMMEMKSSMLEVRRREVVMNRVDKRWRGLRVGWCWNAWLDRVEERRRRRRLREKVITRRRYRRLTLTLERWSKMTDEKGRRRNVLRRAMVVACDSRRRRVASTFLHWSGRVEQEMTFEEATLANERNARHLVHVHIVHQRVKAKLLSVITGREATAIRRWWSYVLERRVREVLLRASASCIGRHWHLLLRRTLSWTWQHWVSTCRHSSKVETVTMFREKRNQKRLQSICFQKWRHWTRSTLELRRRMLDIMFQKESRSLQRRFREWREYVSDRREVRSILSVVCSSWAKRIIRETEKGKEKGWRQLFYNVYISRVVEMGEEREDEKKRVRSRVLDDIANKWCRASMFNFFRRWRESVVEDVRVRRIVRIVVARRIYRQVKMFFYSWAKFLNIKKRRLVLLERLGRRVREGRMERVQEAIIKWCSAVSFISGRVQDWKRGERMLQRWSSQFQNLALLKRFFKWREVTTGQRRRKEMLIRKGMSRMQSNTRTWWCRWLDLREERKRMSIIMQRALDHMVLGRLSRAMASWCSNVELRNKAKKLLTSSLARGRERRGKQRTCWLEWKSDMLIQQVAALEKNKKKREKIMLRRILHSWLLRIQRKCLNGWCLYMIVRREQRKLGAEIFFKKRKATMLSLLRKWDEHVDRRLYVRRVLSISLDKKKQILLVRGFRRWCECHRRSELMASRRKIATRSMVRVFIRISKIQLMRGFTTWSLQIKEEKKQMLLISRVYRTLYKTGMSKAFRTWLVFSDERRWQRQIVMAAMSKMLKALSWRCWSKWNRYVSERRKMRGIVSSWIRTCRELMQREKKTAVSIWWSRTMDARERELDLGEILRVEERRRILIKRIGVRFRTNPLLRKGWSKWCSLKRVLEFEDKEEKRRQVVVARSVLRWTRITLSQSWLSWCSFADEIRRMRVLLRKVVGRLKKKKTTRAFVSWLDYVWRRRELRKVVVGRMATQEERNKRWGIESLRLHAVECLRTEEKRERGLTVLFILLSRSVDASVKLAFQKWREKIIRQREEERRRRNILIRWRASAMVRAMECWQEWVIQRRTDRELVARFLRKFRHRTAARCWRAWVELVAKRKIARGVMRSLVASLERKKRDEMRRGWKQWTSTFHVSLLHSILESHAVGMQRHQRRFLLVLLRRKGTQERGMNLTLGFERWKRKKEKFEEEERKQRVLRGLVGRMQHRHVGRAMLSWREAAEESVRHRVLMERMIRRMKHQTVAAGFAGWVLFTDNIQERRNRLRGCIKKWIGRRLAVALEKLKVNAQKDTVHQVKRRMHCNTIRRFWWRKIERVKRNGFVQWHQACEREKYFQDKTLMALHQMLHGKLKYAFEEWQDTVEDIKMNRQRVRRAVHACMNRLLTNSLRTWTMQVKRKMVVRNLFHRCASKYRKDILRQSMLQWTKRLHSLMLKDAKTAAMEFHVREVQQKKHSAANVLKTMLLHAARSSKRRSMRKWTVVCWETKKQEMTAVALATKWNQRDVLRAWNAWTRHCSESKRLKRLVCASAARMMRQGLHRTISKWKWQTFQQKETRRALQTLVRRCRSMEADSMRFVLLMFAKHVAGGKEQQLMMERNQERDQDHKMSAAARIRFSLLTFGSRELRRKTRRAYALWYQQCLKAKSLFERKQRVLHQMFHGKLKYAFEEWQDTVEDIKMNRQRVRRAVHACMNRLLTNSLRTWTMQVKRKMVVRNLFHRCASKYRKDILRQSMLQWTKRLHSLMLKDAKTAAMEFHVREVQQKKHSAANVLKTMLLHAARSSKRRSMRKWTVVCWETKKQEMTAVALAAKWNQRDVLRAWNAWSTRVDKRLFLRRLCKQCGKNYRQDAFRHVLAQWARCVHALMLEESRFLHISAQMKLDAAKAAFQNAADEFRRHERTRIETEEKKLLERSLRRALGWWTKTRLARALAQWREKTACRTQLRILMKSSLRKKITLLLRYVMRKWSSESLRLGAKIELARASIDLSRAAGEFRKMKRVMTMEKLADRMRSVFEKRERRSMLCCLSMLKRHAMRSRRTLTTSFVVWQKKAASMKEQRYAKERTRRVAERALRHALLRKQSRAFQKWLSFVDARIEKKRSMLTLLLRRYKETCARGLASVVSRRFGRWKSMTVQARMFEMNAAVKSSTAAVKRNMLGRLLRSMFVFLSIFSLFSLFFSPNFFLFSIKMKKKNKKIKK